ncbi:hypothetical protein PLAN_30359 [Planktothrix rubescens CCAP 1459/22]|uniref:Uncharacterized protein n=1 Tax=Planktothrix rubescens CCAP 1459/22 TaxID=329571 RepID=A0A6J7ZLA4_PLARU|nr:hypothetical protein PLAN_30359 [Planktothrix rubescens NIVA-CYA 18]CAD0227314.1 conserved hypothetical protein [Planktothrix agardhii]
MGGLFRCSLSQLGNLFCATTYKPASRSTIKEQKERESRLSHSPYHQGASTYHNITFFG